MPETPAHYIRRAVFRLDFPVGIPELHSESRPIAFQKALLGRFPIMEEQPQSGFELQLGPASAEPVKLKKTTYHFRSADGACRASLDADFLSVHTTQFTAFEEFRPLVEMVVNGLSVAYPDTAINRVGLRYINVIPPEVAQEGSGLNDLVEDDLLTPLARYADDHLSRVVTTAELLDGAKRTRIVTGYANPDYPGLLLRREFLIDIDVYTQQSVTSDGILSLLDDFQETAKTAFLRSVKGRLSELVGG